MMKKITPFLLLLFALISYEMNGQTATCDGDTIDVTVDVQDMEIDNQHAETLLTANNTIKAGGKATYKAGTSIILNAGFKVELGGEFSALIDSCALVTQKPFITKWDITSTPLAITIPTVSGESYLYTVDWGDGDITTGHTGNASHTYDNNDTYTIKISGDFPRIDFRNGNSNKENQRIKKIIQWGDIEWTSMNGAFYQCLNLDIDLSIPDNPDLDLVTDMTEMFYQCDSLTQGVEKWNVSNVTNMKGVFQNAGAFNTDLKDWDVRNVTDMGNMLDNSGLSRNNYENTLIGWANLEPLTPSLQTNVDLGALGLEYCSTQSITARGVLTNSGTGGLNWNIVGDSDMACSRSSNSNSEIPKENTTDNQNFSIYPNPAKDKIHISGIDLKQNTISIQILDVSGRVVLKKENQTEIDISILKAGVYFVKVLGETQKTIKLIKE
jgi:surface protein